MRRWIASLAMSTLLAGTVAVAAPAVAAPPPPLPPVQTKSLTVSGGAGCDVRSGRWIATWTAHLEGSLDGAIQEATDHVNGTTVEYLNRLPNIVEVRSMLPLGATTAGVTVTARWGTESSPQSTVRTIALPDCVRAATTWCPEIPAGRPTYAHTFDAANSTATVRVSNGIHCYNRYDTFALASYHSSSNGQFDRYAQARNELGSGPWSSTIGTVVLRTDLPNCRSQLILRYGGAELGIGVEPSVTDAILGGPNIPSVGPYGHAAYPGRLCVDIQLWAVGSAPDGTIEFTLHNSANAVLAERVTFWVENASHGYGTNPIPPGATVVLQIGRNAHQDAPLRGEVGSGPALGTYRYGDNYVCQECERSWPRACSRATPTSPLRSGTASRESLLRAPGCPPVAAG